VRKKVRIPEGLFISCENCRQIVYRKEVERNLRVCPKCNYHFRIPAAERIALLTDPGTFTELDADLAPSDPLSFVDTEPYEARLAKAQQRAGLRDAALCGEALVEGMPVCVGALEFSFMGGSMGSVVGERVTRLVERCLEQRKPLILFTSSGGARMQEGIFSLMQMAKTAAAVARLHEAGVLYLSILTDPTFGGVTASFAMLGDVIIAEPRALIGFAGPRVIEQTIKQQLPEGFQRAEFQLQHGQVDMVVERRRLKRVVATLLRLMAPASSGSLPGAVRKPVSAPEKP